MMATLEVGYELKDVAEFLVASQGYAPIDGWNYEEILETLIAKKGRLTPEEFAESIVKNQINFSRNYKAGGRSMNLSCVDLKKAAGLRKALNNLAKVFNNILDKPVSEVDSEIAERNAVVRESIKGLIHHSHYFSQTYLHEQAVDISDFVKSLSANCDLKLK
jgi:acetyl-CoA acetyltransferase